MKDKKGFLSPLFLKYQAEYEKNPRGRVFAPLAEMYRKVGMTDRAMEILAAGIRYHPKYVLGYLGMAHCYFDIQQFSLAYSTLKPFVEGNRDNLKLQRLFADVCLSLDKKEEALDTFKYLLFMMPKEKELAEIVGKLEDDLHNIYKPIHNPIKISESDILNDRRPRRVFSEEITKEDFDADAWVQLPLNEKNSSLNTEKEDPLAWEMQKAKPIFTDSKETAQEDRNFKIVLDLNESVGAVSEVSGEKELVEIEAPKKEIRKGTIKAAPIITHTLVDLYIGQGHIEKALELLEKILILNPDDQKTHDKIIEINQLLQVSLVEENDSFQKVPDSTLPSANEEKQVKLEKLWITEENKTPIDLSKKRYDLSMVETEEDGRKVLMDEISQINVEQFLGPEEKKIDNDNRRSIIIKKREVLLNAFLAKIRNRADKFKNL